MRHQRVQRARAALDRQREPDRPADTEFGGDRGQATGEIGPGAMDAQVAHAVAAFDKRGIGAFQRLLDGQTRRGSVGDAIGGGLELQDQPLERLQQRVMQFARDPFALGQPDAHRRVEPVGQLAHTDCIDPPQGSDGYCGAQQLEPDRLHEGRRNFDVQRRAGPVPDAVVVRGDDPEAIDAGPEVAIDGLAPAARIDPCVIDPFHPVAKADAPRDGQAERGIGDLDVRRPRSQLYVGRVQILRIAARERRHHDGRRQCVSGQGGRINHHHPGRGEEPDSAVGTFKELGTQEAILLHPAGHPVGGVENLIWQRDVGPFERPIEVARGHPYDPRH